MNVGNGRKEKVADRETDRQTNRQTDWVRQGDRELKKN